MGLSIPSPDANVPGPQQLENKLKRLYSYQGRHQVDLGVFLNEVMEAFGGPRELAVKIKKTYDACASKPYIQQKLLMMVQQLIYGATMHSLTHRVEARDLTDSELRDLLSDYLGRINDGRLTAAVSPREVRGADPEADVEAGGPDEGDGVHPELDGDIELDGD